MDINQFPDLFPTLLVDRLTQRCVSVVREYDLIFFGTEKSSR